MFVRCAACVAVRSWVCGLLVVVCCLFVGLLCDVLVLVICYIVVGCCVLVMCCVLRGVVWVVRGVRVGCSFAGCALCVGCYLLGDVYCALFVVRWLRFLRCWLMVVC